ncbi:hypothetical protein IFM89_008931 [Coptis chinensis]|uniref:Uncharacterized protein n=1 Tax=Coptis chinensis TaxID=261450 RepID=A0A835I0A4_9MAGN|nr:hypothetical protein IFM89_008931 [Coptis chinensis]
MSGKKLERVGCPGKTKTQVLVGIVGDDLPRATELVSEFWRSNLKAEFMVNKKVKKLIDRAVDSSIPWMIIEGDEERNGGRRVVNRKLFVVKVSQGEGNNERKSFLSLEEAGLVDMSGLSTHERFLCRLTPYHLQHLVMSGYYPVYSNIIANHRRLSPKISSLNLLKVISEQESFPIEELNAGSGYLTGLLRINRKESELGFCSRSQWDDSNFQI